MNLRCAAVNSAWFASCLPSAFRFRAAVSDPREAQLGILQRLIRRNSASAFGREHRFGSIDNYEDFAKQVPIRCYEEFAPSIERIRKGEHSVLTSERVTHLIPTSGSTSARKLIPFTQQLQREFDAAIAPWISDLFYRAPQLLSGPAYWSITPKTQVEGDVSAVPVGFASDAEYLGGMRAKLVEAVIVRPPAAALSASLSEFRAATLAALVRARDLRLISVWHPSFLTLLLDELPGIWPRVREEAPRRSLPRNPPADFRELWPDLKLISCWGDGHAQMGMRDLERRFPGVTLQVKGLLATEGCVSLPLGDKHPLAITSHFFEFGDASGKVRLADELEAGAIYEIVLTTGGGLWRYRLNDRVRVNGFVSKTPSVQFVGRAGQISDLRGEKLSEAFVADCLRQINGQMRFAMLAPSLEGALAHYVLIVEGEVGSCVGQQVDRLLSANIHYREARELGQLGPVRTRHVANAYTTYAEQLVRCGQRLGDIKPVALAKELHWEKLFSAAKA